MRIVSRTQHEGRTVLAISTGLSAHAAAKSRLQRGKRPHGYLITPAGVVHPWIPEGTFCRDARDDARVQREGGGILHIWGPDFDGVSLLDIITNTDTEAAWLAFHRCFTIIARAASGAGPLGSALLSEAAQSGPEAIFRAKDNSVLILPGDTYRRSLASHGVTVERENRLEWVLPDNDQKSPEHGIAFLAGACAYRIVGGVSPFMNTTFWSVQEKVKETEDTFLARLIRSGYVLPLNLLQPKINSSLCKNIMNAITMAEPAAVTSIFEFGESYSNLIDLQSLQTDTPQALLAKKTAFEQKQMRRLSQSTFVQKNTTKFLVIGIIAAFVIIFGGIFITDMASKPTTEGLEPQEVVNGFYEAVDLLDSNTLQAYSSKSAFKEYSGFLTSMYMTLRFRENYEGESKISTPIEIFEKKLDNTHIVYGITNLTCQELNRSKDLIEFNIGFYLFIPENLAEQNELPDTTHREIEEPLAVYYYRDTCTLSLKKGRWIVSDIQAIERSIIEKKGTRIFEAIAEGSGATLPYAPSAKNQ
ncbi:MAG TPA: hypothetical protein GXZ47_01790 [Treponema sp.]|nr:hypothetical protein [Treponema sp.]